MAAPDTRTVTAPLALIKVNGSAIGRMKNITITETIRRGRVLGLGAFTPQELPALEWAGVLQCGFYMIDFNKSTSIPGGLNRNMDLNSFIDTVLLQDTGVEVDLLKKVASGPADPTTGIIPSQYVSLAEVKGVFLDRDGMNLQDGNLAGRDQEFSYSKPVLFTN